MLNVSTHNAVSFCTNYSSLVAAQIQGRWRRYNHAKKIVELVFNLYELTKRRLGTFWCVLLYHRVSIFVIHTYIHTYTLFMLEIYRVADLIWRNINGGTAYHLVRITLWLQRWRWFISTSFRAETSGSVAKFWCFLRPVERKRGSPRAWQRSMVSCLMSLNNVAILQLLVRRRSCHLGYYHVYS